MKQGISLTALALALSSCSSGGTTPAGGGTVTAPTPTPTATIAPTPTPSPSASPTPGPEDPNPLPVPVGPVLTLNNNLVLVGDSLMQNIEFEVGAQVSVNVVDRGFATTSSGTLADYLAYPDKSRTVLIWTGHNNFRNPDQVIDDIGKIVAAAGHSRYLVIGLVFEDAPDERIGGTSRAKKIEVNTRLAAIYGDRFIDTQALLNAWGNPNNSQDRIDLANGVTPSTLRATNDLIHLRHVSGERVLINGIRPVLTARGY